MQKANMEAKTVVITGATAGIGFATALQLAGQGAFVIGVGRALDRCNLAKQKISAQFPQARIAFLVADLSSQKQIHQLAGNIGAVITTEGKGALDVLINNAGAVSSWYTTTPEGFELQFAVNHLAPFLLTNLLWPYLQKAPDGRVITVSSGSHFRTKINWGDIQLRKGYHCLKAYKQSKLANVLFTCELNRRREPGSSVRAYAVDPGLVNTEIGFKGTTGLVRRVWSWRARSGRPPEKGAATSVYLANQAVLPTRDAVYWVDCRPSRASRYALREDMAGRLWELSAKMCGIRADLG